MAQVQYQPDGRSGAGMKRQATWDALPDIDLFSSMQLQTPPHLEEYFGHSAPDPCLAPGRALGCDQHCPAAMFLYERLQAPRAWSRSSLVPG